MLPSFTVAAATAPSAEARHKAILMWIAFAAIAHWLSLGALLMLPACCVMLAISMRRHPEMFRWLGAAALILIASVSVHYVFGIRHAQGSASLQAYWASALPPADAGVWDRLQWMYGRLAPFVSKPGGSEMAVAVWCLAWIGFTVSNRALGATAGLVVASGFVLGGLGLMPLYERLSLWFLPALYLGIALAADRAVSLFRQKPLRPAWMNPAIAIALAAAVLAVCVDVVQRGIHDLRAGRPAGSNHATDDRAAVAWLMAQRQAGEIVITTKNSLPAIWWYGGASLAQSDGRYFADGGRILFAEYHETRHICRGREPHNVVDGRSRVHVYLGFGDMPAGFDDLLLERLSKLGTIVAVRHFAGYSRVATIDQAFKMGSNFFWEDAGKDGDWPTGCVAVNAGQTW